MRAQVSRGAPPPLPGGYTVGEKVFFTGSSQTFADGDKVVHGQQGEVTGPATLEGYKGKGVCVLFPGNKGNVHCYLTTVRRPSLCPRRPANPAAPHRAHEALWPHTRRPTPLPPHAAPATADPQPRGQRGPRTP